MKKRIYFLALSGILLCLGACSRSTSGGLGAKQDAGGKNTAAGRQVSSGGDLSLLYHLQNGDTDCTTENGYYYLSEEVEELSDGRAARHLMYMDFAARQEIFLCSSAGCGHDTADCTSVFLEEEFGGSPMLFTWNGALYLMSKEMDDSGSVYMGAGGADEAAVEAMPTVLYRMEPDGSNREKIYAFDPSVTVEDFAVADEDGFYLITKKVSAQQIGGNSYRTFSERNLVFLDPESGRESVLYSMDLNDSIEWEAVGCSQRQLVLHGIDFGREVSLEEKYNDDTELYDTAADVFLAFDVDSGEHREIYRVGQAKSRSFALDEEHLYYSMDGDGKIFCIDLALAEQELLCSIPEDTIWGMVGERIYTRDPDDNTYYFIDTKTGEVSHCGLVNRSLGWSLEIVAEAGDQVLVIYDYEAKDNGDGSYSIQKNQFGLISRDDLYAGRDKITPIQMIGSGM